MKHKKTVGDKTQEQAHKLIKQHCCYYLSTGECTLSIDYNLCFICDSEERRPCLHYGMCIYPLSLNKSDIRETRKERNNFIKKLENKYKKRGVKYDR